MILWALTFQHGLSHKAAQFYSTQNRKRPPSLLSDNLNIAIAPLEWKRQTLVESMLVLSHKIHTGQLLKGKSKWNKEEPLRIACHIQASCSHSISGTSWLSRSHWKHCKMGTGLPLVRYGILSWGDCKCSKSYKKALNKNKEKFKFPSPAVMKVSLET